MIYDLFEHRHRFSVWAGARAAQRGWAKAKTPVLGEAVENCGVVGFLRAETAAPIDELRFEEFHRAWCRKIVTFLEKKGIPNATYGRAAKLVAVYLKAMVVVGPSWNTDLARVLHPPIDEKLLDKVSRSPEISSLHQPRWGRIKWTKLDAPAYYQLIAELKESLPDGDPFWTLERFWTVTDE
jgi:hypothetical protein